MVCVSSDLSWNFLNKWYTCFVTRSRMLPIKTIASIVSIVETIRTISIDLGDKKPYTHKELNVVIETEFLEYLETGTKRWQRYIASNEDHFGTDEVEIDERTSSLRLVGRGLELPEEDSQV